MIFFVAGKIVQLGVLIQNVSVMPILHFLTRKELLDFFDNPIKKRNVFLIETIFFVVASLGTALLDINVSIVLSLDGAIIGFFMAYGIPIYMHLKCYHFKPIGEEKEQLKKSLLAS
jgi:sodium-coupled neutral amino acid transporter 9